MSTATWWTHRRTINEEQQHGDELYDFSNATRQSIPTMVSIPQRTTSPTSSDDDRDYATSATSASSTGKKDVENMMDVTMDDLEDSDYYQDGDYAVEVPPSKRHQRRHRAAAARRLSSSSASGGRSRCAGRCGWAQVLFVLGWAIALVLFGMLINQLNQSNKPDDDVVVWENETDDANLTPQDYKNMEDNESVADVSTPEGDGGMYGQQPSEAENANPDQPFVLRINTGSHENYIDPEGNSWMPEKVLSPGLKTVVTSTGVNDGGNELFTVEGDGDIYNLKFEEPDSWNATRIKNALTEGMDLFRDERFFETWGEYNIIVPQPDGPDTATILDVTLYFCEIWLDQPNERVFQVYVEDQPLLGAEINTLDLVAMGNGTAFVALPIQKMVTVYDGKLTIRFKSIKQHAKISAIEVVQILS